MKKFLLVAVLVLGFSVVVMAQDAPTVEVYGGYAYFHPDSQGSEDNLSMHGYDASVAINGNKWLGFLADFGGYYDSINTTGAENTAVKVYTMMFGPKISFRKGKVTAFGQALWGYGRVRANTDATDINVLSEDNFAMAYGGGVDINLNNVIAIRPAQVEYLGLRMGGDLLNNFRYSAGVVFRFGKR